MKYFEQIPTSPNEWLYDEKNEVRTFYRIATLPSWHNRMQECTNEEKEQWETLNKQKDENKLVDEIEDNE